MDLEPEKHFKEYVKVSTMEGGNSPTMVCRKIRTFNLLINELEYGESKDGFEDDIQLFRMVQTQADSEELQKYLSKFNKRATKWEMRFIITKCKPRPLESKFIPPHMYRLCTY